MSGQLKIDEVGARSILDALKANASARQSDLRDLAAKARPDEVWQGQAAKAYDDAYTEWQQAEERLVEALNNLAAQAQKVVDNFFYIDQNSGL